MEIIKADGVKSNVEEVLAKFAHDIAHEAFAAADKSDERNDAQVREVMLKLAESEREKGVLQEKLGERETECTRLLHETELLREDNERLRQHNDLTYVDVAGAA